METWAQQEVGHAHFGDQRLTKRLVRLVSDLSQQPTASVPQACGDWAATKAAYRFWDQKQVTPEAIRAAHRESTVRATGRSGDGAGHPGYHLTELEFAPSHDRTGAHR